MVHSFHYSSMLFFLPLAEVYVGSSISKWSSCSTDLNRGLSGENQLHNYNVAPPEVTHARSCSCCACKIYVTPKRSHVHESILLPTQYL